MNERFDFEEEPVKRRGPQLSLWDVLTALMLLAALGIGAFFVYLFINPTTPLNPLQPHLPTPFVPPTATITPIQLGATWTPTTIDVTDTATLAPTITLQPSPTFFSLVPPTKTPVPTSTPKAPYSATVSAIESTIIHPDLGCNWTGIGGNVVDASGAAVMYLNLRLTGTFDGKAVDIIRVSGGEPYLYQGVQSSFEFVLGDKPIASNKLLTLQLLGQDGLPKAENVYIITYNDCKKNLILVRFKENR